MAIILDANVIIRGEKGIFDLQAWLASQAEEQFEVAAITVAELWHGVERANGLHKMARLHYLQTIINPLPIIPYTEQTAYEHAKIWARLTASGKMVSYYDLLVAATALERGSTVASFNKRHFDSIAGLQVLVPK